MKISTYIFDTTISATEIPYLRGNMIQMSGGSPLFHNHSGGKFNYLYPLVQCKRIDKYATVVGISQGAQALSELFLPGKSYKFRLGHRQVSAGIKEIITRDVELSCSAKGEEPTYKISRWLPLNGNNYRTYRSTDTMVERITMLERILLGNILSFSKGVGVFFDQPITCRILSLSPAEVIKSKGIDMMSFQAEFKTNVNLPEYIGLGKSVSKGNGVVTLRHG